MNNITQANQQDNISKKPELCLQCFQFFGNPQRENLCSKCFKDKQNMQNQLTQPKQIQIENTIQIEQLQQFKQQQQQQVVAEDSKMEIESQKLQQVNVNVCHQCPRKIGHLGYKCKCDYTFCKFHRLPEDHECNYDFKIEGKEKLTKENPQVMKSKLEKKEY